MKIDHLLTATRSARRIALHAANDEFMAMLSAVQTAGHVPADPSYMRPLVASTR